ncbi:hypothetical protein [Methylocapsa acidiphila]|uniref:hypothetical protein n=1 Tax=Methylocapsa acidiphila TaxID=133552 RepID=UPI0012EC636A|nr:hypothetical protein [Methylocapsa acidiphila]
MPETPKFMQGVSQFEGKGLDKPVPLPTKVAYTVPGDKHVRPIYFRAGNSSDELIYLVLTSNGSTARPVVTDPAQRSRRPRSVSPAPDRASALYLRSNSFSRSASLISI